MATAQRHNRRATVLSVLGWLAVLDVAWLGVWTVAPDALPMAPGFRAIATVLLWSIRVFPMGSPWMPVQVILAPALELLAPWFLFWFAARERRKAAPAAG